MFHWFSTLNDDDSGDIPTCESVTIEQLCGIRRIRYRDIEIKWRNVREIFEKKTK